MNHKYSFNNIFDDIDKRNQVPPIETLKKLGLETGDRMADIGAGLGYYSIPAARVVGEKGKVYFLEKSEDMIKNMKHLIKEKNINNIEIKKVEKYNMMMDNDYIDFILLADVISEIEDKERFIKEIVSILKIGGKIGIIDNKGYLKDKISFYKEVLKENKIEIIGKEDFGKEYTGLTGVKLS